jgi:hypothetical protein
MYRRKNQKALTHIDLRSLHDAYTFAEKIGKTLNATITIHLNSMETYPADVGAWLSWFLNKLRQWCVRRRFGYYAIWVRENYKGEKQEHIHVMLHTPEISRSRLKSILRSWIAGDERAVEVGRPKFKRNRFGGLVNTFLTYIFKQMTPQAKWKKPLRRETHSRKTGLPVASVLGKRCGVSRSLDKAARETYRMKRFAL